MDSGTGLQAWVGDGLAVELRQAGPGTRFLAWLLDQLMLVVLMVALAGLAIGFFFPGIDDIEHWINNSDSNTGPAVLLAVVFLAMGFSTILFYGIQEVAFNGQTLGKHLLQIRVVSDQGFPANASSIWIRSFFRIVDHFPLAWLVPAFSSSGKRFGDMVAGTTVISLAEEQLSPLRQRLHSTINEPLVLITEPTRLIRLQPEDFLRIEAILERIEALPLGHRISILNDALTGLCCRMDMNPPAHQHQREFLEEILRWEYRRRSRRLG